MESFFSKKVTLHQHEAPGGIGFFVSLFPMMGALGRFLGPFIAGYILTVDKSSTQTMVSVLTQGHPQLFDLSRAYSSSTYLQDLYDKSYPASRSLCYLRFPTKLFVDSCKLNHVNIILPIAAGCTVLFLVVGSVFYLPKYGDTTADSDENVTTSNNDGTGYEHNTVDTLEEGLLEPRCSETSTSVHRGTQVSQSSSSRGNLGRPDEYKPTLSWQEEIDDNTTRSREYVTAQCHTVASTSQQQL